MVDEANLERRRVLVPVKILVLRKIPEQHMISALWTMAVPQTISALQMIAEPQTTAVPQMTPDPRIILVSRMVPAPAMKILFAPPLLLLLLIHSVALGVEKNTNDMEKECWNSLYSNWTTNILHEIEYFYE